jgi:hypothetical protein
MSKQVYTSCFQTPTGHISVVLAQCTAIRHSFFPPHPHPLYLADMNPMDKDLDSVRIQRLENDALLAK